MKVESVDKINDGPLQGRSVTFTLRRNRQATTIFACVLEAHADELSAREDLFLPALVLTALVNGEDLDLGGISADPLLVRNCLSAARQHADWVPRFRVPHLSNWVAAPEERRADPRLAVFFSGGIDSLFTFTRHSGLSKDEPTRLSETDAAIALHVFHSDSMPPLKRNTRAEETLGKSARTFGALFVPVFSNIMVFDPEWHQNYARVTHSSGLASIARVVSHNLSACMIGSSHTYGTLHAWGSSPIVDSLYSSRGLAIIHDGSTFTRFEKTEFISRSSTALGALNVCDQLVENRGYVNCSRCQKCLRTMTALDLCGVAGPQTSAFDWSEYSPTSLGRIYFKNWSERSFAEELVVAANARGRHETARVIQSAIRRSTVLAPMASIEDRIRHMVWARRSRGLLLRLRTGTYRAIGLRR